MRAGEALLNSLSSSRCRYDSHLGREGSEGVASLSHVDLDRQLTGAEGRYVNNAILRS